jgi:uncharacterized protein (TIGR02145 family)
MKKPNSNKKLIMVCALVAGLLTSTNLFQQEPDLLSKVRANDMDAVKKLIAAGADINQEGDVTYKTITIGTQEWMSENLNTDRFRNGDPIPEAKTDEDWEELRWEKQPAWCYYELDPANGEKYGRLYNWFAVNDPRGLAPEGWRIPGDEDWDALRKHLVIGIAGKKMKSAEGWKDGGNGTNVSGFNGLPSGYRDFDGSFNSIGSEGYWWSSAGSDNQWASCRYINADDDYLHKHNMPKHAGLSVRCIKD